MLQAEGNKGISKNLGRGNQTTKPKKNTVASLLAQTRRDSDKGEKWFCRLLTPHFQGWHPPTHNRTHLPVNTLTGGHLLKTFVKPCYHFLPRVPLLQRRTLTRV